MKKLLFFSFILILSITGCSANSQSEILNGIGAKEIIRSIDKGKPMFIQDKTITDDLNFTSIKSTSIVSSTQIVANVEVPVTFLNCIFVGKVLATSPKGKQQITTSFGSNVTFEGCDFRGDCDFSSSSIEGVANFAGAKFRENAVFNNTSFKGDRTYFTSMLAEKMFSMQESVIWGQADFFGANFKSKVSFQSTDFKGVAQFGNLQCEGKAEFSLTTFRSNALFTYAKFKKDFRFSNVHCHAGCNLVSMQCSENFFLNNTLFGGVTSFANSEINGILDVSGTIFVTGKPETEGLKPDMQNKISPMHTTYIGVSQ